MIIDDRDFCDSCKFPINGDFISKKKPGATGASRDDYWEFHYDFSGQDCCYYRFFNNAEKSLNAGGSENG